MNDPGAAPEAAPDAAHGVERRGTALLLLGMLAWVAAAFIGAIVVTAVLGFAIGLLRGWLGPEIVPPTSLLIYVLIAACGFQGVLLLAALRQGLVTGAGDRCEGLGARPIRHQGMVVIFCLAMIIWLGVFITLMGRFPALRDYAKSVTPNVLTGMGDDNIVFVVLRLVLVAVLAPVSEEFFFRGWVWEALRQRGHATVITACLTAFPWLLLHGVDAPGRILFLIPAAVIFSMARSYGGSVRASLCVHVTNNSVAVLVQAISTLFGHGD
jgi:membrane protease YdiL (CAAX protease family)